MTPVGTSDAFGPAPRLADQSLQTGGAFPLSQLQPASSTIFPRAVVKLSVAGVRRRAVPLPASATHRAVPAGVVTVKARGFPSRDQSRSRIRPDNPDPVTWRVRPVAGSRISTAIVPLETAVWASRSPAIDHAVEPRRPPVGTSSVRSV